MNRLELVELKKEDLDALESGEISGKDTFKVNDLGLRLVRDNALPRPLTHTCRGDNGCGLPLQDIDLAQHIRNHYRIEQRSTSHPAGRAMH